MILKFAAFCNQKNLYFLKNTTKVVLPKITDPLILI